MGNNTQDKLFLLSVDEWKKPSYYLSDETSFSDAYDDSFSRDPDKYTWWLRTMYDSKHAYAIDETNKLMTCDTFGVKRDNSTYPDYFRIRPAMWVDLTDTTQWSREWKIEVSG